MVLQWIECLKVQMASLLQFTKEPPDSRAFGVGIRTASFAAAPCVDRKFDWIAYKKPVEEGKNMPPMNNKGHINISARATIR